MKRLVLLVLLVAGAANAQPAAPPATAVDLARLLMQRDETLYGEADGSRHVLRLREALLQSPGACNSALPDCVGAAEVVARRYGDVFRAAERARAELLVAGFIAERMSADEAARLLALLRSAEGERLLALLAALRDPRHMDRRRREAARMGSDVSGPLAQARAEFRSATRNIPTAPPR